MNYKAIVLDLDRTLLHTDKSMSANSLAVLQDARSQGMLLMLATSRPKRSIKEYVDLLEFDALTLLNGAKVICKKGIYEETISKMSAENFLGVLFNMYNPVVSAEIGDELYANKVFKDERSVFYNKFPSFPNDDPIYKININNSENVLRSVKENLSSDMYYSIANNHLIQIMSKRATKWNGIKLMLGVEGILPRESVYFGDDYDDIEPLIKCGIGVAVSNAIDEVKDVADHITESNDNDGVAKFIKNNLLMQ